jgi:hypothetical protein
MAITTVPANAPEAAELEDCYPTLYEVGVPTGTSASKAWRGILQPFADDISARDVLRAFEKGLDVVSDRGFLSAGGLEIDRVPHWAEPYLLGMNCRFETLVLDFEPPHHPFAYGIFPRISRLQYPAQPHLREDRPMRYAGDEIPALCVYMATDRPYHPGTPRIIQFIDQVAGYLGKHLIWTKTRKLFRLGQRGPIYSPSHGEAIFDTTSRIRRHLAEIALIHPDPSPIEFWDGYWPGPLAPSGFEKHLRSISPNQECWCGTGKAYKDCHHDREAACLLKLRSLM